MSDFNYNDCLKILFQRIPEIKNLKEPLKSKLADHLKDNLTTCIFEDVVCYYFLDLMKDNSRSSEEIMKRISQLIEDFVTHSENTVRGLGEVGFIEALLAKLEPPSDIEKYLLPHSLEAAKRIGWDIFGLDYRIGWKKAKEWHYPYEKYFGMIPNKPEAKDVKLKEIYDQLYSREDGMPGGVAFMLGQQVKRNKEQTLLPKAKALLDKVIERITDDKRKLSKSDFETAEVIMHNLKDAIKLAEESKKKAL
jgi:hypothetical protein